VTDLPTAPVVVVVDDEESIHRLLATLLRQHGFATLHASTLRETTTMTQHAIVDAFVLDLNLGIDSGLDVLAWLRQQAKYVDTPVLILTGLTRLSEEAEDVIRRHRAYMFYKVQNLDIVIDYLKKLLL
jgi:DNA-binding response OmpR family regulator